MHLEPIPRTGSESLPQGKAARSPRQNRRGLDGFPGSWRGKESGRALTLILAAVLLAAAAAYWFAKPSPGKHGTAPSGLAEAAREQPQPPPPSAREEARREQAVRAKEMRERQQRIDQAETARRKQQALLQKLREQSRGGEKPH